MDSTRDADCGLATSVVVDMVFLLCGFMAGIAEQQLAQLPATPAKVDRLGRAAGLERGSRTSGLKGLWVKLERSLQPYQLLERSEEKCDLAFGLGSNGCLGTRARVRDVRSCSIFVAASLVLHRRLAVFAETGLPR